MGAYTASPKKTAAGHGSQRWSEVRRRLVHKRYLCLWVLLALVPCYMLRQMFSSSSPRLSSTSTRPTENIVMEKITTEKPVEENYELPEERFEKPEKPALKEEKSVSMPRAVNVFREEVEKTLEKKKEEKVEKVEKSKKTKKTKKTSTSKSSFSDHSLEKYDGDFGVPEDNDKEEEQNWQAPPASIKKPTNVEQSRR